MGNYRHFVFQVTTSFQGPLVPPAPCQIQLLQTIRMSQTENVFLFVPNLIGEFVYCRINWDGLFARNSSN